MPEKLEYVVCDLLKFQEYLDKYTDKIKFIVNYDSTKILIVIRK